MIEPRIFRLMKGNDLRALLTVHVDDLLIVCDKEQCDKIKGALVMKSPTKDLGELSSHGGCAFERN
ncbi:unnamed protein product [Sphacelaria rigidula]